MKEILASSCSVSSRCRTDIGIGAGGKEKMVPQDNVVKLFVKNLFTSTEGVCPKRAYQSFTMIHFWICGYVYMDVASDDAHQRPYQ